MFRYFIFFFEICLGISCWGISSNISCFLSEYIKYISKFFIVIIFKILYFGPQSFQNFQFDPKKFKIDPSFFFKSYKFTPQIFWNLHIDPKFGQKNKIYQSSQKWWHWHFLLLHPNKSIEKWKEFKWII